MYDVLEVLSVGGGQKSLGDHLLVRIIATSRLSLAASTDVIVSAGFERVRFMRQG